MHVEWLERIRFLWELIESNPRLYEITTYENRLRESNVTLDQLREDNLFEMNIKQLRDRKLLRQIKKKTTEK